MSKTLVQIEESFSVENWAYQTFVKPNVPTWGLSLLPASRDPIYRTVELFSLGHLFMQPELKGRLTTEDDLRNADLQQLISRNPHVKFAQHLLEGILERYGQFTPRPLQDRMLLWHPWVITFGQHLRTKGKRPKTLEIAKRNAQKFINWLPTLREFENENAADIDLYRLRPDHIDAFELSYKRKYQHGELARNTVIGRFDVIKNFLRFCTEHYGLQPMWRRIHNMTPETNPDYWLPGQEELSSFFEAIRKYSPHPLRDMGIFGILAVHGLRPGEVIGATWDGMDFTTGNLYFEAKGGDQEVVELIPSIQRILHELKSQGEFKPGDRMFQGARAHVSGIYLQKLTFVYGLIAGWPMEGIKPYTFRHLFCTSLLMDTNDYLLVNNLARHNDLNKTKRYLHLTDRHVIRAAEAIEEALDIPDEWFVLAAELNGEDEE